MRLTPKSSVDAIDGVGMRLTARLILRQVRAVPEKGAANAALEKLLASSLGLPKSAVSVVAGRNVAAEDRPLRDAASQAGAGGPG